MGAGGGGVGLFGHGPDANQSLRTTTAAPTLNGVGYNGSDGTNGAAPAGTGQGGLYGGGAGGHGNAFNGAWCQGGGGAVRIVWGANRVFPNYCPDV